jgi:hypothetical protein
VALYDRWLQECLESHEECDSSGTGALPTRLLDLRQFVSDGLVRLVETDNRADRYIALSYSWGGRLLLTTTKSNIDDHKHNIMFSKMPQTFQDLILLAVKLGINYLWIDSLCVIQDNAEDWAKESVKMADVYGGANLVVIAADAPHPGTGFLGRRDGKHAWRDLKPLADRGVSSLKIRNTVEHAARDDAAARSIVARRTWCYQERLLGHRRLICRDNDIFWECQHGCRCA